MEKVCLLILLLFGLLQMSFGQKPELVLQTGHASGVISIVFSPDGKYLASGDREFLKIWDVKNGKELRTFIDNIGLFVFSSDWKYFASAKYTLNNDFSIKLWSVESGNMIQTFIGHSNAVTAIAFNSDGETLVSGSSDGIIKTWDIKSGKELQSFNTKKINPFMKFCSDGKTLAIGDGWKPKISIWDIETEKELFQIEESGKDVFPLLSPDCRTLYIETEYPTFTESSDVQSGKKLKIFEGNPIGLNSNGKILATSIFIFDGSNKGDGTDRLSLIKFWDTESGLEIHNLNLGSGNFEDTFPMNTAFSPNDNIFAFSGYNDNSIKFWDVKNGKKLQTFLSHSSKVFQVLLSPNEKVLAFLNFNFNNPIKLWDLENGKELQKISSPRFNFGSFLLSPDGKTLEAISKIVS